MALRSALEDFEETTLVAISGLFAKLQYLASLHDGEGNYAHWGMERVHGTEVASRALRSAHVAVLTRVLRAPLQSLLEDVRCSSSTVRMPADEFVRSLNQSPRKILPERSMPASQKHLMAVLHALSVLVEKEGRANRQGASRYPPLAR